MRKQAPKKKKLQRSGKRNLPVAAVMADKPFQEVPHDEVAALKRQGAINSVPELYVQVSSAEGAFAAFTAGADTVEVPLHWPAKEALAHGAEQGVPSAMVCSLITYARQEKKKLALRLFVPVNPKAAKKYIELIQWFVEHIPPHAFVVGDLRSYAAVRSLRHSHAGQVRLFATAALGFFNHFVISQKTVQCDRVFLPPEVALAEVEALGKQVTDVGFALQVQGALGFCAKGTCRFSHKALGCNDEEVFGKEAGVASKSLPVATQCKMQNTAQNNGEDCETADGWSGNISFVEPRCTVGHSEGVCRQSLRYKGKKDSFLACVELGLQQLVRQTRHISGIKAWIIAAQDKSSYSIMQLVQGYVLFRDQEESSSARKQAEQLFSFSLTGPSGNNHFMADGGVRKNPLLAKTQGARSLVAGKFCGTVDGEARSFVLNPGFALEAGDVLFIAEKALGNNAWIQVKQQVPARGLLQLRFSGGRYPKKGSGVFLVDRRGATLTTCLRQSKQAVLACTVDPGVVRSLQLFLTAGNAQNERPLGKSVALSSLNSHQEKYTLPKAAKSTQPLKKEESPVAMLSRACGKAEKVLTVTVQSTLPTGKEGKKAVGFGHVQGLWLARRVLTGLSRTVVPRISWWLPPLIWPEEEAAWQRLVREAVQKGARHFVCNNLGQRFLFDETRDVSLSAGPFCGIDSLPAVQLVKEWGFSSAYFDPALGASHISSLAQLVKQHSTRTTAPTPAEAEVGLCATSADAQDQKEKPLRMLKLGVVCGWFPVSLSRYPLRLGTGVTDFTDALQRYFWVQRYGGTTWVYPQRPLPLPLPEEKLARIGVTLVAKMEENAPSYDAPENEVLAKAYAGSKKSTGKREVSGLRKKQTEPPLAPEQQKVPSGSRGDKRAIGKSKPSQATGKSKPSQATGKSKPSQATGKSKPSQAIGKSKPSQATGKSKPSQATGKSKPSQAIGKSKPSQATGKSKPSQGTGTGKNSGVPANRAQQIIENGSRRAFFVQAGKVFSSGRIEAAVEHPQCYSRRWGSRAVE